jgi:hypothetical protein
VLLSGVIRAMGNFIYFKLLRNGEVRYDAQRRPVRGYKITNLPDRYSISAITKMLDSMVITNFNKSPVIKLMYKELGMHKVIIKTRKSV